MLLIRSPDPAEAALISELVLQSDCGMLPALFGPDVNVLLAWLLKRPGNPYCSANTLVIAEEAAGPAGSVRPVGPAAGQVIGAMVGSPMAAARGSNLRTAGQLARWYGPAVIARLPRLARAGGAVESLARDDFYLSHIAVLPAHRGRGAGAQLLRAAEGRASGLGARRLVLDVEEHNDGARAFYTRMGYGQESVVRIDLGRYGLFSFLRLARDL
jgi:ribosomal protein S18 acetylase RimI-like enzyme